jgi:hypothetical protein
MFNINTTLQDILDLGILTNFSAIDKIEIGNYMVMLCKIIPRLEISRNTSPLDRRELEIQFALPILIRVFNGIDSQYSKQRHARLSDKEFAEELKKTFDVFDFAMYLNETWMYTEMFHFLKYIDADAEACALIAENYIGKMITVYDLKNKILS